MAAYENLGYCPCNDLCSRESSTFHKVLGDIIGYMVYDKDSRASTPPYIIRICEKAEELMLMIATCLRTHFPYVKYGESHIMVLIHEVIYLDDIPSIKLTVCGCQRGSNLDSCFGNNDTGLAVFGDDRFVAGIIKDSEKDDLVHLYLYDSCRFSD